MKRLLSLILAALLLLLCACGGGSPQSAPAPSQSSAPDTAPAPDTASPAGQEEDGAAFSGLRHEGSMDLRYAEELTVDYYEGGFKLLTIGDGNRYLLTPEGQEPPAGLPSDVRIIRTPLKSVYLAATAAMALFDALDALDVIRLSGTQADGWYIENAAAAMRGGDILFAGKYSEPDYELLVEAGCDLAIESTMILHTPKVQEMIERLGIPVFIEHSSYESHPLGRTEWIRLYGAMLDREEEAEAFFDAQAAVMDELENFENTEKTVAFFYISSGNKAVVRTSDDYIAKMIGLAGGRYVFSDLTQDSANASVSLSLEEFYAAAVNADYLIYNAAIDEPMESMDELLAKSPLFRDFKAVREGNVWCTGKSLYQATDIVGSLISDIHGMLTGDTENMTFITRLE